MFEVSISGPVFVLYAGLIASGPTSLQANYEKVAECVKAFAVSEEQRDEKTVRWVLRYPQVYDMLCGDASITRFWGCPESCARPTSAATPPDFVTPSRQPLPRQLRVYGPKLADAK